SRTGRTLELTGSVAVEVEAGAPARMAAAARSVLAGFSVQGTLDGAEPDDATLVAWVRGVLERMRTRGAIDHPWFERYRVEDGNRWSVWGGRRKLGAEGMPAFPAGRPAPGYPRVGGAALTKDTSLEPVASARSWFGRWTARVLGVTAADGGSLVRLLLDRLTRDGLLRETTSQTGARIYALPPSAIVVQPTRANDLAERRHLLVCDVCRSTQPGSRTTVDQLDQRPCLSVRCSGTLRRAPLEDGFYRRLYATTAMRRIVAREHTSLLPDDVRLAYEEAFKASVQQPPDPNVLVATPTLEMGIDIGDLSTVILSSLPRTVASYLQRVGRAGRLTGNALNLAYVTGRGDQLPRLGDPLSVIDGEVRPPATYLQAEEILRRQLTAHVVDGFARDRARRPLRRATEVMASVAPGTFLGDLVAAAEAEPDVTVDRFLGTFPEPVRQALRTGLVASLSPVDGEPRTSAFAVHVAEASGRWQTLVDTMRHRLDTIDALMPELLAKVESPAKTDDDELALRSARAARRLTLGQLHDLTDEYWIGVLEEHGLLPNYTLLDDAVTLDVGLSWVDPDSGEFQTDHASFRRAAGQAIRELAPGATFYARGWQIAVDVVDLGVDGSAVRPWVFCPACGYAVDVATSGIIAAPNACPRCGSAGIADSGQRLDVVELEHVTAEIRRDEAAITDRRDERDVTRFQIVVAADVDAAGVERRWFVEGSGLGCTYLRRLDVRWLNLGVPAHGGARTVAGEERQAGLFRVCAGCGKLDVDAGANKPHEHRPWCA
ncbi:MAG TPA: helicase-related protein, partial [Cellulomonas sp.]|nr:helicase-related protein [Cellulomonas sp.]